MKLLTLVLAAAAGLWPGLSAQAADAVTDAMVAAYPPYRAALFRTNGKSVPESQQALAQAQTAWSALIERFGAKPPPPFDRDVHFATTLGQVNQVYDRAAVQIRDGQLPQAHETLEAARDLMADLRRRNQVVVYSDHMNAYHAVMEHVLVDGAKWLAEPQGVQKLLAQAGVLEYLATRLRTEAPAHLLADAEFDAGLRSVEASVTALKSAATSQDLAASRDAIGKLKPPYSRLFLKYG